MISVLTFFAMSVASSSPVSSCLHHLTNTRSITISAYDNSHDKQGSNSISCNFGLTASEASDDLQAILNAAKKNGCDSLVLISNIPLSVQLRDGRVRQLSKNDICRQQARIRRFIRSHSGSFVIDRLDLLGWRGAFVGSDEILVNTVADGSGRPHLKIIAIGPI